MDMTYICYLHGLLILVQVTGVQNPGRVVSVIVRGSNKLVLEEAERSIHDALCVIRCLVKKRFVSTLAYVICEPRDLFLCLFTLKLF